MTKKKTIDLIYRFIKNYIILKLIKKFFVGYEKFKFYNQLNSYKLLSSSDIVDVVSYIYAEAALRSLSIVGFLIAVVRT